jgi:hypothetical protein
VTAPWRYYGCENSYFSAKVRPALRYKGLPFAEILPTPAAYRDVIRPRTGLAFIPIVVTPEGDTWQDTSEILDAWAAAQPAGDGILPRGVGLHATTLRGVPCQRYTSPYLSWMAQRPQDAYAALTSEGRTAVDAGLAGTGCAALLSRAPHRRVTKRKFQLVLGDGAR